MTTSSRDRDFTMIARDHRGVTQRFVVGALVPVAAVLTLAACGSESSTEVAAEATTEDTAAAAAGVRLVDVDTAAATVADPPDDLVVLDVRTPEEFAEGHLDGATMIDFYESDFADQIAELDRDVPYVLYCRSGNRSGETAALMAALGFSDVSDVNGGIIAWQAGGQPVVTD